MQKVNLVEYKDGDLDQLINNRKDEGKLLEEELVLNFFVQICLGLKEIHDKYF